MKTFFLLFSTIITSYTFSQNKLNTILSNEVCNCLTQNKSLTPESLITCFTNINQKNSDLINIEGSKIFKDTSLEMGYKYGQQIYSQISISMIYDCPTYFKFIDSSRYLIFQDVNKDSIKKEISFMNDMDSIKQEADFYIERGMLYFKLFKIESALADFDKALIINENAFQSMYFMAWIFEINKNYDDAYLLYNNLANLTNNQEFKILAALVQQKKKLEFN